MEGGGDWHWGTLNAAIARPLSHFQLLEQTRLRVAIPLLEDPYIKPIDVDRELGYEDITRARIQDRLFCFIV